MPSQDILSRFYDHWGDYELDVWERTAPIEADLDAWVEHVESGLASLAGSEADVECNCPEPCWCAYDRPYADWEESDIGEEVLDA